MGKQLNINVSGGQASFGNVVQGDNSQILSVSSEEKVAASLSELKGDLLAEAGRRLEPPQRSQELMDRVAQLEASLKPVQKDEGKAKQVLKAIVAGFEWSGPIIKVFIEQVWPGLSLLG